MDPSLWQYIGFAFLGIAVGGFGTLIGVGGGFVLVPILLWLFPSQPPEIIAGISLAVVFFNAFSGSIAYGRQRRIDYRSALLFAACGLPGTILGALTTAYISRHVFDIVIGLLLAGASVYILYRSFRAVAASRAPHSGRMRISLTDNGGTLHQFSYNPWLGGGLSAAVGYVSSMLGIGGGIIHVPALVHLLHFPVHIATATSHAILAVMALSGSVTHLAAGQLQPGLPLVIPLGLGAVIGAQAGARLSHRVRGALIIRILAIALLSVGLRTLWGALR